MLSFAMSNSDWLLAATAIPAVPIFTAWWLSWDKWVPVGKLPKAVLGPYSLYLFFLACHFDEHLKHWWAYVPFALVGVVASAMALVEKIKGKPEAENS